MTLTTAGVATAFVKKTCLDCPTYLGRDFPKYLNSFKTKYFILQVKTSQEVCVDAKKPSMGFAETCGAAFEYGPKRLRPWANFAR